MGRFYPALDLTWPQRPDDERIERLLAEIDDDEPLAVEDLPAGVRVFFAAANGRTRAAGRLAALEPSVTCALIEIPDDDWAERSQAALGSVQVGRIVIAAPDDSGSRAATETSPAILVTVARSMGFGTGHHASTRLCLDLLQRIPLDVASVLDVGTGSGVLAIVASRLGAARVVAIDNDADALTAARENVERNDVEPGVTLSRVDLAQAPDEWDGAFDLLLANLTGALLTRQAARLSSFVAPGGRLILSGIMAEEADGVISAFAAAGTEVADRSDEDGWVGLLLTTSPKPSTAR